MSVRITSIATPSNDDSEVDISNKPGWLAQARASAGSCVRNLAQLSIRAPCAA